MSHPDDIFSVVSHCIRDSVIIMPVESIRHTGESLRHHQLANKKETTENMKE